MSRNQFSCVVTSAMNEWCLSKHAIIVDDDSQDVVEAWTFWLENEAATVDFCDDGMKGWGLHVKKNSISYFCVLLCQNLLG
jgi:hypothetical protein